MKAFIWLAAGTALLVNIMAVIITFGYEGVTLTNETLGIAWGAGGTRLAAATLLAVDILATVCAAISSRSSQGSSYYSSFS